MRAHRLRIALIGTIAVAGVLSVLGSKTGSAFISWLSFAVFLVCVFLYFSWRQEVRKTRTDRVFDREAKTPNETRASPDE
jgi:uncharacterized membrane protein YfcA